MSIDFSLKSWIPARPTSDFPIQNLPFGIFKRLEQEARVCSIIGDKVIDLAALQSEGLLPLQGLGRNHLQNQYLNDFIRLGKPVTNGVRNALVELLREDAGAGVREQVQKCLYPVESVQMQLPIDIGDYTDFYSSKEHATNVGTMFRGAENALMPNWLHLPVAYHGRASSIVVSGTPIRRPKGQRKPPDASKPIYGTSQLLDFELEMGFVIGKDTALGESVTTSNADDHIFGLALFNDWSARDIQGWEYVPLGPFLGKNFASTLSPWIITLEALEPFRTAGPDQDPEVLPYLQFQDKRSYDIHLEAALKTEPGLEQTICTSNHKYLYWNMAQQLAHHTVNGCNIRIGDLYASGTISGKEKSSYGSMLELTWRGANPIKLTDGSERKFINDGDEVILRGWSSRHGVRVGFGEARGVVLPANI